MTIRAFIVSACLVLAAGGCARDPTLSAAPVSQRTKLSFEAARERCGITVADTAAVKSCMRAQGWIYRLPWE
jgi:hypothetical protein